ncbi:hypothetical protein HK100_012365, partial [Physocladia obscura]
MDTFFDILDLPREGGSALLERYFHPDAFRNNNPYDPIKANAASNLLPNDSIDAGLFRNRIRTLGNQLSFLHLTTFLRSRHYEIGQSLIVETSRPSLGKNYVKGNDYLDSLAPRPRYGRLAFYRMFSRYPDLAQIFVSGLWLVVCLVLLILPPSVCGLDLTQPIVHYSVNEEGMLQYLNQVGKPPIEEVMISYSWQDGLMHEVRTIARSLIHSEIRVWIDYLRDETARTTRTVASKSRFVVIFLTRKYIKSGACFVEILSALNTKNPNARIIVHVHQDAPDVDLADPAVIKNLLERSDDQDERLKAFQRVQRLARKLEEKGVTVTRSLEELVKVLNQKIVYASDTDTLCFGISHAKTFYDLRVFSMSPALIPLCATASFSTVLRHAIHVIGGKTFLVQDPEYPLNSGKSLIYKIKQIMHHVAKHESSPHGNPLLRTVVQVEDFETGNPSALALCKFLYAIGFLHPAQAVQLGLGPINNKEFNESGDDNLVVVHVFMFGCEAKVGVSADKVIHAQMAQVANFVLQEKIRFSDVVLTSTSFDGPTASIPALFHSIQLTDGTDFRLADYLIINQSDFKEAYAHELLIEIGHRSTNALKNFVQNKLMANS